MLLSLILRIYKPNAIIKSSIGRQISVLIAVRKVIWGQVLNYQFSPLHSPLPIHCPPILFKFQAENCRLNYQIPVEMLYFWKKRPMLAYRKQLRPTGFPEEPEKYCLMVIYSQLFVNGLLPKPIVCRNTISFAAPLRALYPAAIRFRSIF